MNVSVEAADSRIFGSSSRARPTGRVRKHVSTRHQCLWLNYLCLKSDFCITIGNSEATTSRAGKPDRWIRPDPEERPDDPQLSVCGSRWCWSDSSSQRCPGPWAATRRRIYRYGLAPVGVALALAGIVVLFRLHSRFTELEGYR